MKLLTVFRKTLLEMSRDKWMLGLTLAFAPFFVLLYWLITAGGSTTYTILTINNDKVIQHADGTTFNAGHEAIGALKRVTYADGQPILKPVPATNRAEAETILRNRGAAAFILIQAGPWQEDLSIHHHLRSPWPVFIQIPGILL